MKINLFDFSMTTSVSGKKKKWRYNSSITMYHIVPFETMTIDKYFNGGKKTSGIVFQFPIFPVGFLSVTILILGQEF